MRNKKLLTSAVALGTAAVLLFSGTFAWQSISQTAENEAANIVNPGGRLHDDFDGSNKDIYVENFGEEPIFARVRLEEFLALIINQGTEFAKTEMQTGGMAEVGEGKSKTYTYSGNPYTFDVEKRNPDGSFRAGNGWWKWQVGSEDSETVYYMPTFNKNKDSLAADVNGWYKDGIGTFGTSTTKSIDDVFTSRNAEGSQYEGYTTYTADSTKEANAIYDIDRNLNDELATLSAARLNEVIAGTSTAYDGNAVQLVEETHTAQRVGTTRGLISMAEWLNAVINQKIADDQALIDAGADDADAPYDIEQFGNYWVYDEDGWVYWSAPIMPGTATGLLLDGIQRTAVMDDSYYYAINVVAQFVTADDLGKDRDQLGHSGDTDGTGFYDTTVNADPTASAENLLKYITDPRVVDGGPDAGGGPDTYAVFYKHEGEDGAPTTYRAYYLSADSVSDAEFKAWGLSEDMNIAWSGKAAKVDHNTEYVKNTVQVQVGGKYIVDKDRYDSLDNKVTPTGSMSGWFQNMGASTESGADFYTGYYPSGDETRISTLDTSNVTDMSSLFKGAKFALDSEDNGFLYLTAWNTSNVTDMSHMFEGCSNLVWLVPGGWDTSSVTDMSYMFSGCTVLEEVSNIEYWDTSSVTDMSHMFENCAALVELEVPAWDPEWGNGWDTSKVTDMSHMFENCSSLKSLEGAEDWDTSSVTDVRYMFNGCRVLALDCSGWDVSQVKKGDVKKGEINYRDSFSANCDVRDADNPGGIFVKPTPFYS